MLLSSATSSRAEEGALIPVNGMINPATAGLIAPDRFADTMRHAIALNGSFFNTRRVALQYV